MVSGLDVELIDLSINFDLWIIYILWMSNGGERVFAPGIWAHSFPFSQVLSMYVSRFPAVQYVCWQVENESSSLYFPLVQFAC